MTNFKFYNGPFYYAQIEYDGWIACTTNELYEELVYSKCHHVSTVHRHSDEGWVLFSNRHEALVKAKKLALSELRIWSS